MAHYKKLVSDPATYDGVVDGLIYAAYGQLAEAKTEIEAAYPHLQEFGGEHSKAFNALIVIDGALELLDEIA
jgi:hypothetical protein